MLKTVDLSKSVDKKTYDKYFPKLQLRLRQAQKAAFDAGIAVSVVFEGWDGAGKGSNIEKLVELLDPRGYRVHPVSAPTKEERQHPFLWRYWRKIPPKGRIAVFDRSWYGRVLVERVDKLVPKRDWQRAYDEINQFERTLADEGMVFVKFWLHISRKEQRKRFRKCERDPLLKWRVTDEDWRHHKQHKKYFRATEEMLERTNTHWAPWTIVESTDKHHAIIETYETVINAIEKKLQEGERAKDLIAAKTASAAEKESKEKPKEELAFSKSAGILARLDLTLSVDKKEYQKELVKWQARLRELQQAVRDENLSVVVVYEGMDAAGKGGNIKRITGGLDPRGFTVVPIAAPTPEEKAHHYLWRFWTKLPQTDHITIYDRSWYGRVLVERVEGFCSPEEWHRAFQEINEFERQLTDWGYVLVKFWVHIDQEEQLKRFKEREKNPLKNWKLTPEDWRNREKSPLYERAASDMLEYTSTTYAPWTVIEGNDKYWARIKALKTVIKAIEDRL